MTRLGMVPELAFAEDFKQLRRDIEEIKRAQRVGRDILKPKIVQCYDGSGNPTVYDLVATAVPDGFGGYQVREFFTAYFTADNQSNPWATPIYELSYGTPGTPPVAGQTYGFSYPFLDSIDEDDGEINYHGYFGNNDYLSSVSIYIKVYFYASDTGTLTVTNENTL